MPSYRVEKMGSQVRLLVSEIVRDELSDPRISSLTSVTRVQMTPDLQMAKIFFSVLGTEPERRRTMAGLENAVGRVQRLLAKRLQTRHCPVLRFEEDVSLKRAAEMIGLIDQLDIPPIQDPESAADGEVGDDA